ncbi:MAG: AAA family ATPase, partial [Deltaproteobacteria bacterium]|nr:AAA family ATPase [Deltaproteobacteria bacterium]
MSVPRDLFDAAAERDQGNAPLADRMRPASLDEIMGQDKILGPGRALRSLIEGGEVPSMILWGPPGSGKTMLARVIAKHVQAALE